MPYYSIPVTNNYFQLLIILAYNNNDQKTKIYLKLNFNFSPKILTTDFSLAEIMAIRKIFPLCKNLLIDGNYRGICKAFANFEYEIIELLDYFDKKSI